jgi:hypothetical protein
MDDGRALQRSRLLLDLTNRVMSKLGASRRTAAAPVSLGMTVEVHGAVLEVKWNPASPVVGDSEGALDFTDGPDVNRIELNQAQLRVGHFD